MAPRNNPEENCASSSSNSDAGCIEEEDIAEIEAVNQSLDSLSNALDMIEERTDGIKARLLELLNSNKEIRESIVAEKSQDTEASK
ncbi:unnamed protein product [Hermetia illucens]|uniref:Uncharacterized protein n=1 Tax=Hermetia illucens TaxID=343691 RepID=A0A7R8YZ98_HERIL|nr:UPF0184 protein CG14818 [Hermetia illucens]CAD7091009.1 unnamed protein product [Hermetia illucens]